MKRRSAASPSSIQSAKRGVRIELAQQAERAIDQPVIEPSRCYQRRNGHRSSQTSCRPHRRSDRQRQVGTGARARRATRRSDRQRRQRADLSRPADPQRRADRRRPRAAPSTGCTACSTAPLPCSAADWAAMARREIADIHAQGRLPILVGGTGLYLRTLLDGIAPVPPIDPDVRRRGARRDVEDNRARAAEARPGSGGAARSPPTRRGSRARSRSCCRPAGRSAEWQQQREGGIGDAIDLRPLILLPPRDWLYARCDERFAAMIEQGAVEEVEALLARELDPAAAGDAGDRGARDRGLSCAAKSIADEAIAAGQQATRQLRQAPIHLVRAPAAARMAALHASRSRHRRRAGTAATQAPRRTAMEMLRDADIDPCRRSTASASRSSASATRAARRRSTSRTAASTWWSACAPASLSAAAGRDASGFEVQLIEEAVAAADVVMLLAPDEILGELYASIEPQPSPRRGAGFQPRARDPLRPGQAARPISTSSWSRPRAPEPRFARSTRTGEGMIALWAVAQDRERRAPRASLSLMAARSAAPGPA